YMACAVPVVASPVGANNDVVTVHCGLMAETTEEWIQAIRTMRDDPALRQRMGKAGRQRVVERYSLKTALSRFAEVIHLAAKS
ncbi:MAG: glycosyltransferase, partial [Comamonadaceae bacterium]